MSNKNPGNFQLAIFLSENYGNDLSEAQIFEVAKELKKKPNLLLRNYKHVSELDKILKRP